MRHVKTLGLCLAAVLAVCACAVSSASALPEWGKCEAKAGGKYSDANCTVKAKHGTGSYEWKKGSELTPTKFHGANVGSGGVLYSDTYTCGKPTGEEELVSRGQCAAKGKKVDLDEEDVKIECEAEHNSGEAVSKDTVANIAVVFTGCKLLGAIACTTTGAASGEIRVEPLKGKLGYINKAEHKVGVLLEPAKKDGPFVQFNCATILGLYVGVGNKKQGTWYEGPHGEEKHGGYDGIISPITPVDTSTTKYTQVYTVEKIKGNFFEEGNEEGDIYNLPNSFEGKHFDGLEVFQYNVEEPKRATMFSPAGEEITNENTTEEATEIKA